MSEYVSKVPGNETLRDFNYDAWRALKRKSKDRRYETSHEAEKETRELVNKKIERRLKP